LVIIDDNKNIQRIIDVIKKDTAVFDNGETEGLLREVNFGDPNNNDKISIKQKPAVYVTTRNSTQKTSYPYGVENSTSIPSNTVEYEIVLLAVSKEKTEKSQKQLYTLLSNLRTTLEADPKYSDPENLGTDEIFTRSVINEIPWDVKTKGQLITSISLILIATIGETSIINIPGFGDLTLISDTGDEGRNSTGVQNDIGDTKISKGANVGSRFFEYEYNTTTYESIEVLITADNELALTLKYSGGDRTYNAKLVFQRDSIRFDGIRTVILQADKITA